MSDVTKFVDDFKIAIIERNQKIKMLEAEIERLEKLYRIAVETNESTIRYYSTVCAKLEKVREWAKTQGHGIDMDGYNVEIAMLHKILDGE